MSSRSDLKDAEKLDKLIGSAVRQSVMGEEPPAQVRRNLLMRAGARQSSWGPSNATGTRSLPPVWPGFWTLWAMYAACGESHMSVLR